MALSQKALQRKREKKKNKRRQNQNKERLSSSQIDSYVNWPIYQCWVQENIWEIGIGHVIIARKQGVEVATGIYLVDVYCLGVKNCFEQRTHITDYEDMLKNMSISGSALNTVEASYANTLIQKAIDYAKGLGFNPHSDFVKARKILKNIPLNESLSFNFGSKGKPLYIPGPNDTPADIKKAIQMLEGNVGHGNYHFTLAAEEVSALE